MYGSGRTDAGVHASGQVAHLDVSTNLPPNTLRVRINDELPHDINILDAAVVPHRFHARHDAVARRYVYQIARRRTAFHKAFVWWVKEPLQIQRMQSAATAFVGMRDFASFAEADDQRDGAPSKSTRVLVERLDIVEDGDLGTDRRRRFAFPLEDGSSRGRRVGRSRPRWTCARRGGALSHGIVRGAGAPDRAAIRLVSRPCALPQRSGRSGCARAYSARSVVAGSMRAARRAGTMQASVATAITVPMTAA